jgi:hypothetical protein
VTKDRYSGLPAVPPIAAAISATATAAAAAATTTTTTAAATTAAAARATTATATTATAAAATAATALRALFGFVHAKWATVNHLAVDAFDGALGLLVRTHGDEREAAGLPSGSISHDVDISHFAVLREGCADGLGIRVK